MLLKSGVVTFLVSLLMSNGFTIIRMKLNCRNLLNPSIQSLTHMVMVMHIVYLNVVETKIVMGRETEHGSHIKVK